MKAKFKREIIRNLERKIDVAKRDLENCSFSERFQKELVLAKFQLEYNNLSGVK